MVKRIFIFALALFSIGIEAVKGEDTRTGVNHIRFNTLKTEVVDNFMSPPVITLGSNERIRISFDEIGEDNSYLSARLVHCNADWQPSGLVESEYLESFNTMDIDDYAFSTNTFIHYVNYMLEIPSEGLRPMVSGNYLLQVYDRDAPDDVLLQTRFRIAENMSKIGAHVTTRTDRGVNDRFQQLEIAVDNTGNDFGNPYQDVKVEVVQNGRESTSRFLKSPLRLDGNKIMYGHSMDLLFPASNEYRRFESTSTRFPGMRVDSTKYEEPNYHTWVNVDYPRNERNYEYDRTQHGRFIVREYNSTDSNIGADYITVHFFLDTPELKGEEVYIDGEFTMGKFDERNRMEYNGEKGGYELQIPLKQGAYNYQYVTLPKGSNSKVSTSAIEGDKYETENEYNIYVYLRKPGDRYDRLVGYTTVFSN